MITTIQRQIKLLTLENDSCPFQEWLDSLNSAIYQSAVDARITRLRNGNFGDFKSVGKGVSELRIQIGPGLRIYYAFENSRIIILIGGGTKKTQNKDIKNAQILWRNYKNANRII